MRILVISDSHGSHSAIERAIEAQPAAKDIIFLGDGENEIEDVTYLYPDRSFYIVCGNCDWGSVKPASLTLQLGEKTVFACHGHTYSVKYSIDNAVNAARKAGADILLFGHTHIAITDYRDGLYIMNPGSISCPHDFGSPSYGYIDITPAGILTGIVR